MIYPGRQMPWDASSGKLPDPSCLLGWCLLPAIPGSAAMARAYVRISLRQQAGDFPDADAAESIIGELVANALQHAYHDKPSLEDTVLLALCDVPQGLMVLAADQSDDAPTPRSALAEDAETGRGLHLVAALAARWGWEPRTDSGKVVYAVIENKGGDQ
jgi:anti-sigma regulatory factor (Ser/Thr protein kinase)